MKKKLIFGTAIALITISANGLIYASNRETISADTLPPIVQQVNDHEERIGTLEETTEEIKQEVAETKTQVNQTKERTTVLENSTSATSEAIREYREQQAIETPKLREGEIVHVKKYPTSLEGYAGNDPRWTPNAWGCTYSINTVTIYKIQFKTIPLDQDCQKVGDLISSIE